MKYQLMLIKPSIKHSQQKVVYISRFSKINQKSGIEVEGTVFMFSFLDQS